MTSASLMVNSGSSRRDSLVNAEAPADQETGRQHQGGDAIAEREIGQPAHERLASCRLT